MHVLKILAATKLSSTITISTGKIRKNYFVRLIYHNSNIMQHNLNAFVQFVTVVFFFIHCIGYFIKRAHVGFLFCHVIFTFVSTTYRVCVMR